MDLFGNPHPETGPEDLWELHEHKLKLTEPEINTVDLAHALIHDRLRDLAHIIQFKCL